jgi:hypothetical protein
MKRFWRTICNQTRDSLPTFSEICDIFCVRIKHVFLCREVTSFHLHSPWYHIDSMLYHDHTLCFPQKKEEMATASKLGCLLPTSRPILERTKWSAVNPAWNRPWIKRNLTPGNTALPQNLAVALLVKWCSFYYSTRKFITDFTRTHHWKFSWTRTVQAKLSHPVFL